MFDPVPNDCLFVLPIDQFDLIGGQQQNQLEIIVDKNRLDDVTWFADRPERKSGMMAAKKFSKFKSLLAGFPAGTVSGAPKIRAMEIIDELETTKRKVYAGGIGYFSANGEFDTCIALRTAIAKKNKFYVQAGAGIVADSKPLKEYEETVNKAKALINALK